MHDAAHVYGMTDAIKAPPRVDGTGQAGSRSRGNGFRRLFKEMALGALLGGLSSAGFYGAGKALEVLKRSVGGESGTTTISTTRLR